MAYDIDLIQSIRTVISEDKRNIFYLLYYSIVEAILTLSIPLASSFVINSILAHATISIFVLGSVIISIFIVTMILQIFKEYIIEKFQQKIFVTTGIKVASLATNLNPNSTKEIDRYMNYFFDITAIQKIFPIVLLDGTALIFKLIASLFLLLLFDPLFFQLGLFIFFIYLGLLLFLGRRGSEYAIKRSDAKHKTIYFLQHIPEENREKDEVLREFDHCLREWVEARRNIFKVIIKQLSLTFFTEGLIFSGFLIVGGYLVVNGTLPIGEFVAVEIVVVSIVSALKGFMKQIDYIYDMIEGFYKVNKLSSSLEENYRV